VPVLIKTDVDWLECQDDLVGCLVILLFRHRQIYGADWRLRAGFAVHV